MRKHAAVEPPFAITLARVPPGNWHVTLPSGAQLIVGIELITFRTFRTQATRLGIELPRMTETDWYIAVKRAMARYEEERT
jgi:hypothetical protein